VLSAVANNTAYSAGGMSIYVSNVSLFQCHIDNNHADCFAGGIYLVGHINIYRTYLRMSECKVTVNIAKQLGGGMNIFNYNVCLSSCEIEGNIAEINGGGIYMNYANTKLLNVSINNNQAISAGGGVLLDKTNLMADQSKFIENNAGTTGDSIHVIQQSTVNIKQSFFKISGLKSHISISLSSNVSVHICYFSGGLLISNPGCILILNEVTYVNEDLTQFGEGDVILKGDVKYNNCKVLINGRTGGVRNIYVLSGKTNINNLNITCPYRYDIQVSNGTLDGTKIKLEVICTKACDKGYIKFSHGKVKLSVQGHHERKPLCTSCPYGGKCSEIELVAKQGLWGSIYNETLHFFPCIPGHCETCKINCSHYSFNLCTTNRQGPICTECATNYTEALFSTNCIHDEDCIDDWFWSVVIMSAFYILFFYSFNQI